MMDFYLELDQLLKRIDREALEEAERQLGHREFSYCVNCLWSPGYNGHGMVCPRCEGPVVGYDEIGELSPWDERIRESKITAAREVEKRMKSWINEQVYFIGGGDDE